MFNPLLDPSVAKKLKSLLDSGQMPSIDPSQVQQQPTQPTPPQYPLLETTSTGTDQQPMARPIQEPTPPTVLPPDEQQLALAREKLQKDSNTPAHKQGLLAQIAWLGTQGINKYFNPNADVQLLGNTKKANRVAQDERYLAPLELNNQNRIHDRMQNTQIANINADNERQLQAEQDKKANYALGRLNKLPYYDVNNPAHRQLAKTAGIDPEDMKGWDDRNPVTKQVGDTLYKLNRDTGAFESTGIKDDAKTATDYDVVMPNGEKRTYKVLPKDAARFATQMQIAGANIKSREQIASDRNTTQANVASSNQSAITARAQAHMNSLPEAERQKKVDDLVRHFANTHPKATPEQLAEARSKLESTYGKTVKKGTVTAGGTISQ